MNMNLEIEQTKQNIENYQKMLQLMPEERKLQNLLRSGE